MTSFAISSIFSEMDSAFVPESHFAILGENCANESAACNKDIDIYTFLSKMCDGGAMWYCHKFTTSRPGACQGTLQAVPKLISLDRLVIFHKKTILNNCSKSLYIRYR